MEQFQHLKIQFEEITSATNNFDQNNCIGRGGFGKVYKGALARLKPCSMVAFKRLNPKDGQGEREFLKEITFLSRYRHANIISLLGYGIQEKEMILVYEYASRGSLDRHLASADLTWMHRLKICLAAAKGLNYLHDPRDTNQRLIHCDVKSANILLDDAWNAKVADFGLSKIAPVYHQYSTLVTNPVGTTGYCDPEFIENFSLTKESDVYSFGVVLFEVLCGRLCSLISNDGELRVLVPRWKKCYEENKLHEIIFPVLRQNMDPISLEIFSEIAFQCLKRSRMERPKISLVVKKLETALECQEAQNGGTTWFSMNDDGQIIQLTSIRKCSLRNSPLEESDRYSDEFNSRFKVGTYNTRGDPFGTIVTTQKLSPNITYTLNLVLKCPQILKEKLKKQYIFLRYNINNEEKKISIVHVGEKREDEWLVARLHHFTYESSIVYIAIDFHKHEYHLQIEGFEFQPLPREINNVGDDESDEKKKFEEIVKSAEPPLFYTSLHQLKLLLSKGVHLNGGKTWFHLNDSGQHCELISIEGLIADVGTRYNCNYSTCHSRFLVGALCATTLDFKVRVRAQFLTPLITYAVNLVFRFDNDMDLSEQHKVNLIYEFEGQTKSLISYLADKRKDGWWMVELCHFTSEQGTTTADLQIIFQGSDPRIEVEGIEFLPVQEQHC